MPDFRNSVERAGCVTDIVWPDEVDLDVLRTTYGDLADMDDDALRVHWQTHGRNEGRIASPVSLSEDFIALVPPGAAVLEIGPFTDPKFVGPNVRYCDVLDEKALLRRGEELGHDVSRVPRLIHYTPGLEAAHGANLDVVFSSHNIEHHPDLILHLKQAAAALRPGGVYMMVVPDRRYCFDHFLPDLTLARVIGAHLEGRTVHAASSVIEHRAYTCHNDTNRHWAGDHGPPPDSVGIIPYALRELEAAQGEYVDVHAWQFTPDGYRSVMTGLHALGYSAFRPLRVYDTAFGRNEFTAVLQLDSAT